MGMLVNIKKDHGVKKGRASQMTVNAGFARPTKLRRFNPKPSTI